MLYVNVETLLISDVNNTFHFKNNLFGRFTKMTYLLLRFTKLPVMQNVLLRQ